jgi:hypothetical protein
MYFDGNLRSAPRDWRFREQAASKNSFQLFFFNETARQTASIFMRPPTKHRSEG